MKKVSALIVFFIVWAFALPALCVADKPASAATPAMVTNDEEWFDHFYPYRIEINLDGEHEGKAALNVSVEDIIKALADVSPDIVDIHSFAFEKAALVDPRSKKAVGGFKIFPRGANLALHGDFDPSISMKNTPWKRFNPQDMNIEQVDIDGGKFNALFITKDEIKNSSFRQPVELEQGSMYLLSYWMYHDLINNSMGITLYNPAKRIFAQLPRSYRKVLLPERQWTRCLQLYLADIPKPELRITHAFEGRGAVGDISLRKIEWKLIGDLPRKTTRLHLYYVARAGHRFPIPNKDMIGTGAEKIKTAKVKSIKPHVRNLNPDGVFVEGDHIKAWTVPAEYPLKAGYLAGTMPAKPVAADRVKINLFPGGAETLLVAVKTGTPLMKFLSADCDMPCAIPLGFRFEQLAKIPVYDSPFYDGAQEGDLVDARLDALMPLNDPLIPPSADGIHVVAITFTAGVDAVAGILSAGIKLVVQTQVPVTETVEIPVEVRVLPVAVKPVDHFGAFPLPRSTISYLILASGGNPDGITQ